MKRFGVILCVIAIVTASAMAFPEGFRRIKELLVGYEEVPALSTGANGEFRARISEDQSNIRYRLSYSDLEGSVTQAHIHLGQKGVNGGISVWLCSNLASPPTPAGVQPCPVPPATISGTITADSVVGPAGQGLAAGEFAELVRAIRAGATYVNVHSTKYPGGEVRSQIGADRGREHEHDQH